VVTVLGLCISRKDSDVENVISGNGVICLIAVRIPYDVVVELDGRLPKITTLLPETIQNYLECDWSTQATLEGLRSCTDEDRRTAAEVA